MNDRDRTLGSPAVADWAGNAPVPHVLQLAARCLCCAVVVLPLLAGCSRYIDRNVPEPIHPFIDPDYGREYLLYRPAAYDRRQRWPLIVVCHGGFPDSPNRQIRRWTQLAEEKGFVVLAPSLSGGGLGWGKDAAERHAELRADEAHILAAVNHVRAGHSISEHRIFIHGRSAGAMAALYTGLRHPMLFRSVSVVEPKFDGTLLAPNVGIDPYQPVYVGFATSDVVTGRHGRSCIDWLREVGANARESSAGYNSDRAERRTIEFIEDVLRLEPWIHIVATADAPDLPLECRFAVRASFVPVQYDWQFGDGGGTPVAAPTHTYGAPGRYPLTLTLEDAQGHTFRRSAEVTVPGGHVRPVAGEQER